MSYKKEEEVSSLLGGEANKTRFRTKRGDFYYGTPLLYLLIATRFHLANDFMSLFLFKATTGPDTVSMLAKKNLFFSLSARRYGKSRTLATTLSSSEARWWRK